MLLAYSKRPSLTGNHGNQIALDFPPIQAADLGARV